MKIPKIMLADAMKYFNFSALTFFTAITASGVEIAPPIISEIKRPKFV